MIDPRGMSFADWADNTGVQVRTNGWILGRAPIDEANWRDWAVGLTLAGGVNRQSLPSPYAFTDWRKWAERVYPMLEASV